MDTPGFVPNPDRAPYDWVSLYEAAQSGMFGDTSQNVLDRLTKDDPYAKSIYDDLVSKGTVSSNDLTSEDYSNEGGQGTRPHYTDSSVDWSKLPKIGAGSGINVPKGYGWMNIAHDGAPGIDNSLDRIVYRYNDPNYGMLGLVKPKEHTLTDMVGDIMRAGAIGMATGPLFAMASPAIGGALGLEAGATPYISGALKFGLNSAINYGTTGQMPNPFNALFAALKPGANQVIKDTFGPMIPKMPSIGELGQMTDLSNISLPPLPDIGSIFGI